MSPSEQMAHVRFFRLLMKNEFGGRYMHRKAKYYVETPRKCRKDQKNTLKENSI